jgi:hypothetical protein
LRQRRPGISDAVPVAPRPTIRAIALIVCLGAGTVACGEHSVGPARTYDDYERKSRTTAEVVLSAVETVRLLAETASDGKAWGTYTGVSVSEQEDTAAAAHGDFDSIQPPDARADDLRDRLGGILDDVDEHIAAVRIEVRRGNLDALADTAAPLAADSEALQHYLESIAR